MSKNNTVSSILTFVVFLTMILGCRGLTSRRPTNYFESNNTQAAAEAIKDKIGVPFKVFKVEVERDKFTMQIQSPQNADNLDEYQYSGGTVAGPHPVQTDTFYDFHRFVFDYDDKDFAALPQMIQESISKSQMENAEVSHLTLSRGMGSGEDSPIRVGQMFEVRWFITIHGARANTTAVADERGNLQGVDISKTAVAKNYDVLQVDEFKKAVEALRKTVGEEKKIYKISISHDALGAEILNPQNTLDGYRFNVNGFNRAGASSMMAMSAFNEKFSFDETNLNAAADLIQRAVERLKFKNGRLDTVIIERTKAGDSEFKSKVVWRINVKGDLDTGYVQFDAKGNELAARKLSPDGMAGEDVQ